MNLSQWIQGSRSNNLGVGVYAHNVAPLAIRDDSTPFAALIFPDSNPPLTDDRFLTVNLTDSDRTIKLTGDAVLNQDVSTAGSPSFAGITLSGRVLDLKGDGTSGGELELWRGDNSDYGYLRNVGGDPTYPTETHDAMLLNTGLGNFYFHGDGSLNISGPSMVIGSTSAPYSNAILDVVTSQAVEHIYFRGNNNIALLLDRQNTSGYTNLIFSDDLTAIWAIGLRGYRGDSLCFNNGTNDVLYMDTTGLLTMVGALRLDNAYVSGAPTATGYVTVQDSGGTTRKLLCA